MGFFSKLFGISGAGDAIKSTAEGISTLAQGIRSAITGKLPPEKQAEIDVKILELEQASRQMQAEINLAEAKSSSTFVAGWRPFIGWCCGFALAYHFIIVPFAILACNIFHYPIELPVFDMDTLMTILFALLGFGAYRTVEKIKDAAANH